jgi:hypothetical protein
MIPFLEVQPPTIKVKVKRTVPFLQVRPATLKLKVKPQFPAELIGGVGVAVTKTDGIFTVDLDVEKLHEAPAASDAFLIVWDSTTRQFARIRIADLVALMGA